jgi:Domain of unknown function (DUF4349)
MTSSPDLIQELKASRPAAPTALRARVREIAAQEQAARSPWPRLRLPARRVGLVALPAAAAVALASAGLLGLVRSDGSNVALRERTPPLTSTESLDSAKRTPPATSSGQAVPSPVPGTTTLDSAIGPATDRAQRVSATLTVEVSDSDAVSRAAQEALDLTRSLGGYVVSSSVATGEEGNASLTVRVPVGRVQDAITGLSGLGRIVSQQVTIDDLEASLDELEKREASVRGQIARIVARLKTEDLDPQTEAVLRSRLQTLRSELRELRSGIESTNAEARMSTIQLSVVTPGAFGAVAPPSRLDRTIDEALNVLAWEGVIVLGLLIVLAPFALVAFAAWLGRRLYRRHEEERLLAA